MSLAVGTILAGRYRVLARLGDGGMGTVYQAEDLRLPGRLWAIKELLDDPKEPPTERAAALARFDEEVALLARLSNPRIPGVVDRFGGRGGQYFVMDYIPGASLEQRQARAGGPLPERAVLGWGAAVCDVLAYIHAQRPPIILRDLKPANIMVTPEDEVRVIDFGIARTYKLGQRSNTENLGTMIYASPEHLGQTGQTDARSDIYSLGATLYHVLSNSEPRPMTTPTPGALRRLNPALSEGAERVVIRAMQLDPARRYQTAAEMAAALRAVLTAGPAARPGAHSFAVAAPRVTPPLARPTSPPRHPPTQPPRLITAPARVTVPRPLTAPPRPRSASYGAGARYVDKSAIVALLILVAVILLLATHWPF